VQVLAAAKTYGTGAAAMQVLQISLALLCCLAGIYMVFWHRAYICCMMFVAGLKRLTGLRSSNLYLGLNILFANVVSTQKSRRWYSDWFADEAAPPAQDPPAAPASPAPPAPALYDDVACQVCGSQQDEASMLLCDGCDRGYHMRCLGMRRQRPPAGDWFCQGCVPPLPAPTSPAATGRTGRGARSRVARA
jgi:hypothetical protein